MNTKSSAAYNSKVRASETARPRNQYVATLHSFALALVISLLCATATRAAEPAATATTEKAQANGIICSVYQVDENNQMQKIRQGEDCDGLLWLMDKNAKSA